MNNWIQANKALIVSVFKIAGIVLAAGAILTGLGVGSLWSHQAQALECTLAGENIVVVSATASGKTLCYTLPIAQDMYQRPTRRALLIYPTKALAQDQLLSFGSWELPGMVAATYDGDCTPEERGWVREHANVLLTNPEMLHHGILPNHRRWAQFLHSLRFVVIDELHTLRGVFGTHLAQVLRRLRRLHALLRLLRGRRAAGPHR